MKIDLKKALFVVMKLPNLPNPKGVVTAGFLLKKWKEQFPETKYAEFLDNSYLVHGEGGYKDLLQTNLFRIKDWMPSYDCDNFSFSLKGLFSNIAPQMILGVCHVDVMKTDKVEYKHSLNVGFNGLTGRFFFIEPQNNSIFHNKPEYKPYMVII
jgi:hypothetical protein